MELNSLADALSGLQANQSFMDVVGNNISNVNTVGYKTQSIRFEDLMNQTLGYGSQKAGLVEGTNPFQVGMGVNNGTMNTVNLQGSVQDTGRLTDMAIQGNGFFIMSNGQSDMYTRDGSFTVAPDGTLENAASGMTVQGWTTVKNDGSGQIDTTTPLSTVKIPVGSQSATATTQVTMAGNLDSSQAVYSPGPPATGGQFSLTMNVYDSQGNAHALNVFFTKAQNNQWNYKVTAPNNDVTISPNTATGQINFNSAGVQTPPSIPVLGLTYNNGTSAGNVTVDFSKLSQLAQTSQVSVATSDGTPGGTISTFSVGQDGTITAVYSNGTSRAVGQIALADFRNPDGLIRMGNNMATPSVNSGSPQVSVAGLGNIGQISTGQLEGSNVDLAAQFGLMIEAQQGFNANTKVISTTNSLLQSVISIIP